MAAGARVSSTPLTVDPKADLPQTQIDRYSPPHNQIDPVLDGFFSGLTA
jgi:hypothetical protein